MGEYISTRQNEEHIFYIGNCPVCYEYGRLEIDKDINTGKCFIYCEECLAEWDSPQDALKNVNGRRNFQGGPVRGASLEEIVGLEWDKYVVEASVPEDLELLGMYDKTKMEEA